MYIGTISSLFDNPFKYNIKLKNLPFGLMSKIKNEVYVLSDLGKRKLTINIETDNELIYIKANQVNLWVNIDKTKLKVSLKNVTIRKVDDADYEIFYEFILF
jgi:DUF4097 and DUF4098 domain-containing protein YvlB